MSEQRLDLSDCRLTYSNYEAWNLLLAEALRAQASEDALRSIIARLLLSLQDVQTACDCETCKAIEEAKCILGLEE